MLLTLH